MRGLNSVARNVCHCVVMLAMLAFAGVLQARAEERPMRERPMPQRNIPRLRLVRLFPLHTACNFSMRRWHLAMFIKTWPLDRLPNVTSRIV